MSKWQIPPDDRRCTGIVRAANSDHIGERCRKAAIKGGHVCRSHGAQLPPVRKAADRRVARDKALRELDQMGETIEGTDPTAALLGLVAEAAGNVAFLRRKVQQLQQGYVGRIYRETIDDEDDDPGEPGEGIVGPNHLGDGAAHVYLVLYGEWMDKLAKYSKMAIEAGIVERQVRLAEQQGELLAQVIRGVLADLNIAASPEVAAIVGRHLALVSDAVA